MRNPSFLRCAAVLGVALLAAACSDRGLSAPSLAAPAPAPASAARRQCTVDVRAATMACERAGTASSVRGVVLGGLGVNVLLASTGTAYDAGTEVLRSDVTVQNLTSQALGTTDGQTPDPDGVRVFFAQGPAVVDGEGSVGILNADGEGVFTASGQPYFQYDGVLVPGETSLPREWRFGVPATVLSFTFQVYVYAPVPREAGYISLSPVAPSLRVGDTMTVDARVRRTTGQELEGVPVTWSTSDSTVATVDSAGVIAGVGAGTALITASNGSRTGQVSVVVTAPGGDAPPPTIVSFTVTPAVITANGADTVWVEMHVVAPGGVWQAWAGLGAPVQGVFEQCSLELASGTQQDGLFRCAVVLPAGARHGVWTAGGWASSPTQRAVGPEELLAAGSLAFFNVRSPDEDLTPPAVTSLAFYPDTVAPGDSLTIEASFTDGGVGARSGGAYFSSSVQPNELVGCSGSMLISGTPAAGTFRCTIQVPPGTVPGEWTAAAEMIDSNMNIGYTSAAQLQSLGSPVTLTITGP
jgi:hypothetical protein